MKKFFIISPLILILGCQLIDNPFKPTFNNVGLGEPSANLSVINTSGPVTSGIFTMTVNVTPDAMYSFQLLHINGTILSSYGFTATASVMDITLNYSNIPNGAYDLNLMDNVGRLLKVPVIIQH